MPQVKQTVWAAKFLPQILAAGLAEALVYEVIVRPQLDASAGPWICTYVCTYVCMCYVL